MLQLWSVSAAVKHECSWWWSVQPFRNWSDTLPCQLLMVDVNTALDLSTQTAHMQNIWSHASPSPLTLLNIILSVQSLRTLKTQFSVFLKLSLTCYFCYTLRSIVMYTYIHVCLYSNHIPWRDAMKLWTLGLTTWKWSIQQHQHTDIVVVVHPTLTNEHFNKWALSSKISLFGGNGSNFTRMLGSNFGGLRNWVEFTHVRSFNVVFCKCAWMWRKPCEASRSVSPLLSGKKLRDVLFLQFTEGSVSRNTSELQRHCTLFLSESAVAFSI